MTRCPVELTGRYSVTPSTMPRMIASMIPRGGVTVAGLRGGKGKRRAYHGSVHAHRLRHLQRSILAGEAAAGSVCGINAVRSHVAIIGPRGSGKSTVGRQLAAELGMSFTDLDEAARLLTGASSVSEVFEASGEPAWRQAEAMALEETLRGSAAVIAPGGGVPCVNPPKSVLLRARDAGAVRTVLLSCDVDELRRRLRDDPGDRPSLTGGDALAEMEEVIATRQRDYAAAADLVVDAAQPIEAVVASIRAGLG